MQTQQMGRSPMPEFAGTYRSTPASGLQDMAMLARSIPGVLHLEVGDPDFTTPAHIIDAAAAAAHAGFTHYAPAAGFEPLRAAVAQKVRDRNGIACELNQVAITTGAAGGLFSTLLVLLDPGDEVLVPEPGWPTYPAMVHVLHGVPVFYPMTREDGFVPRPEAIDRLVTPRTKAIVISSPTNPSGVVFDAATMTGLLDVARRHDLWVVSDECYDEIIFEGQHVSAATLGDPDRVVTVFTFSKTYAMTGWRIGYVVAAPEVTTAVIKAQRPLVSSTSTISQKAAEAALAGPQDAVVEMVDTYRRRRDLVMGLLDAGAIGYVRPRGAFYVMADVPQGETSADFARRLLLDDAVAVVAGSAFGKHGEGTIRISLAVATDSLSQGIPKLVAAAGRTAGGVASTGPPVGAATGRTGAS
jgi:aspartate aminotransferase